MPHSCESLRPASPMDASAIVRTSSNGLENAPAAFIGMLEGRNFGKALVHVAR
jgi:NADPH-dependent curcumin reductase CurA